MLSRFFLMLAFCLSGCTTVKPYQKERLSDRIMQFDSDSVGTTLRNDFLSAREGSIGCLSGSNAGGCSCK